MADININFLKQFIDLFKTVKEITFNEPAEKKREKRNLFFNQFIIPIHNSIKEIYEDYIMSFVEISELITNKEYCKELEIEIIEEIKKKRLVKLMKRREVYASGFNLGDIGNKSYIKNNEIKLFIDYSRAIFDFVNCYNYHYNEIYDQYYPLLYNNNVNGLNHDNYKKICDTLLIDQSGYSYLFEIIDKYILNQKLNNEETVGLNLIIKHYCDITTQRIIPEAYGNYSCCYEKLRLNYCFV